MFATKNTVIQQQWYVFEWTFYASTQFTGHTTKEQILFLQFVGVAHAIKVYFVYKCIYVAYKMIIVKCFLWYSNIVYTDFIWFHFLSFAKKFNI